MSFTKILADAEAFVERYQKGWALTCQALLTLLVNPPQLSTARDDFAILDKDTDDVEFGVGYTPLQTIKPEVKDPFPQIGDLKKWVGGYLRDADGRHGGRITQYVQQRLNNDARAALQQVLQA